jgi:hypothetical protein
MNNYRVATLLIVLLCCLALAGSTWAQGSSNYKLTWSAVGGGGGAAQSVSYRLHGAIGQNPAGAMGSSQYQLGSGFEYGALARYTVFLPVVIRN